METTVDLSKRGVLAGVRETRRVTMQGIELREKPNGSGGTTAEFNGYASITETPYEMHDMFGPYTEVVRSGAFKKTIAEGCDTAFLINHEGMTLARTKSGTLRLSEDGTGLHSNADLDAQSPIVQGLRSAIDRKDVDEMSFAFYTIRQEWSPDYEQRDLIELSLNKGDVSPVNYGANPYTSEPGISLRSLNAARALRGITMDELSGALREVRAGAALSTSALATLKHVLSLASTADSAVDELQVVLSDLMGVANPDTPEDAGGDSAAPDEQNARPDLDTFRARAHALRLRNTA